MLHYVLEDTPLEGQLKSNMTELRLSFADVEMDPGLLVPSHSVWRVSVLLLLIMV